MKKGVMKYLQYAVVLVIVVVLLCGIFSILPERHPPMI